MFDYKIQYPNINYSAKYTPRSVRKNQLVQANQIMVDITPLDRGDNVNYLPGDLVPNSLIGAVWVSATLNLEASKVEPSLGTAPILGDTELGLALNCRDCNSSLYAVVEQLNYQTFPLGVHFDLYRLATWDELLLTMMEGYSPMVGGTVYSSFLSAKDTGVVPMPTPGEDLLGGHIVNLVSFNKTEDTGIAVSNLGMAFGNYGMLTYRGSYLRNLGICRDFFVLIPRSVAHAHHG